MNIEFSTKKLAKQCSSRKAMVGKWGPKMSKILMRRLDDIDAAECLEDLRNVPGRYHELTGDRAGEFAASLGGQYRLLFRPDHDPVPTKSDRGIDWTQVTKVLVTAVGVDYH